MRAGIRGSLSGVAAVLVFGGMLAACSERARLPEDRVTADSTRGQAKPIVPTVKADEVSDTSERAKCRPAGSLGPANPTSSGPFLATFTAATEEPLGVCGASDWDIQIHSRDPNTWYSLEPMAAQHGMDCAGPPATHETHGDHAAAVFLCRDHLMTALRADGYGLIYLTPNQLVDLSQGPVTIQFDLSTEQMSSRDWVDLWLTPWEENMTLPLQGFDADLQGPPRNAIHVTTASGAPTLFGTSAGEERRYLKGRSVRPLGHGVLAGTNEAATRQTFLLTLGGGRARLERAASQTAPALLFWDEPVDFPFDTAVLQFGHHSYSPTKDGAGVPATWHWDNIGISQAIPFGISRSVERYADKGHSKITFESPSGPDSWLRFSAIGIPEVSFDAGRTWTVAQRQNGVGQLKSNHHAEHFSSYWMDMPAGVSSIDVRFKRDSWYEGPYFAQGFSIWSR